MHERSGGLVYRTHTVCCRELFPWVRGVGFIAETEPR
jgi:hypothetical protein